MSDGGMSQPAGWYYAQGDPPGTHRYWDGSQWVGNAQPVQGADPGGYGQQLAGPGGAAGVPAEWGTRALAWLIDFGIVFAAYIVLLILAAVFGAINDSLASLVLLLGWLGIIGFNIWNLVILQGQGGQSIGKQKMNIRLLADATGEPVGAGMAFVRSLLGGLLWFLCTLPGLADHLWPLFDDDKKRLTDKILNFSVVNN